MARVRLDQLHDALAAAEEDGFRLPPTQIIRTKGGLRVQLVHRWRRNAGRMRTLRVEGTQP